MGFDGTHQIQYLRDEELKSLLGDTVQFGGKTVQRGKQRLSDKWQVAKEIDDHGCIKYIFARPVSKWSKKHGHLEISINVDTNDGKLTELARQKLINTMRMMDIIAQRGQKGADPKSCLPKQNQAVRFLGNYFDHNAGAIEDVKSQLTCIGNKHNSKYLDFLDGSKKAWDDYVRSTRRNVDLYDGGEKQNVIENGCNDANATQQYVTIGNQHVFEEGRLRYKSLVIKKTIGEIFGAIANAFSGVVEPSKKVLATLCKNPNTTSVAIALTSLLFNQEYAIVMLIGYAVDSVKNKILEVDTSQPPQDSFRSKIGYNIAKFFQEHKRTGEVIAATIKIGVQSVVAFVALAVNPVYMVQALIDLTITIVQNTIPAVGNWIEKHPIITQIVVTTITLAAQLTVGILTGSLPIALFTMAFTLGTQIIVSSYGQSIAGWCVAKILNRKTEENNVVLSVEEQNRVDKAKECIEKAREPIGRICNAVSNLIIGVYGVVNKLYSKTVSAVVNVVLGCNLKNPENQAGDSDNVTNAKKQSN